ncbi:MAG TPA: ABC transporter permease [Nitrospirae bacterium]|nr:macrolide export ATP-binding/permease protein MacB [bacterium BMS3Abin06]HDH12836.1 ABC transporter permease [Nitrospirota bacterium]HDZ01613.1 ABC transporter permease [Nitrospirota bacterium]
MLLTLAWKNTWRNKKRSFIIILSIALGLWGSLLAGAVWMGWGESMVNTAIERDLSNIQIHKKGYTRNKEITNFIPRGFRILKETQHIPGVKAVSGRTLVEAMAASPTSTFGVKIVGIIPAQAKKVTNIHSLLRQGTYFRGRGRNPVIIGKKLADRLGLKLHSKIILSFQGMDGSLNYAACRIVGIYKTNSALFDQSNVFMKQPDLFRLLNSKPAIHEIAVRTESSRIMPKVFDALKTKYPGLAVQTWKELAPEVALISAAMESYTYIFLGLILFALLFGITNTMLMAVMKRVREIGVLIAIGMKRGKVFSMILLETVLLSITGGVAGIVTGGLSIAYFSHTGIDLSAFASGMETFGASTMVHPFLPLDMYIALLVMVVATAILSAVLPAWNAIHIQPSEAIRTY